MLKIRLQRVGRKNDASFRVVVIESQRGPKAGNALEVLGFYDPKKDVIEIKGDRVTHWISVGAQASDTLHNLLVKKKIIKGDKINVLSKKSPIKKESTSDEKSEETKVSEKPKEKEEEPKKQEAETKEEKADDKEEVKEKPKEEAEKEEKTEETKKPADATNLPADVKSSGEAKKEDEKKS